MIERLKILGGLILSVFVKIFASLWVLIVVIFFAMVNFVFKDEKFLEISNRIVDDLDEI